MRSAYSASIPYPTNHILAIQVQSGRTTGMEMIGSGSYSATSIIRLVVYWGILIVNAYQNGNSAIGQFYCFFPTVHSGQTKGFLFISFKFPFKTLFELFQFLKVVMTYYLVSLLDGLCSDIIVRK